MSSPGTMLTLISELLATMIWL
eukprot:COSAG03_NODE_28947_length_192_cov_16.741935_1_plen_21_part_10